MAGPSEELCPCSSLPIAAPAAAPGPPRAFIFSLTSALSSAKIRIASFGALRQASHVCAVGLSHLGKSPANRKQTVSPLSQNFCMLHSIIVQGSSPASFTVGDPTARDAIETLYYKPSHPRKHFSPFNSKDLAVRHHSLVIQPTMDTGAKCPIS